MLGACTEATSSFSQCTVPLPWQTIVYRPALARLTLILYEQYWHVREIPVVVFLAVAKLSRKQKLKFGCRALMKMHDQTNTANLLSWRPNHPSSWIRIIHYVIWVAPNFHRQIRRTKNLPSATLHTNFLVQMCTQTTSRFSHWETQNQNFRDATHWVHPININARLI